jgi:hypothetical protein
MSHHKCHKSPKPHKPHKCHKRDKCKKKEFSFLAKGEENRFLSPKASPFRNINTDYAIRCPSNCPSEFKCPKYINKCRMEPRCISPVPENVGPCMFGNINVMYINESNQTYNCFNQKC